MPVKMTLEKLGLLALDLIGQITSVFWMKV